jgi:ferredoxin-NADP reductase
MKLTLISKVKREGDATSFIFQPSHPIAWKAGQFMVYTLPHKNPDIRGEQRFFTISSPPFEKNIVITTKISSERSSSFKKALVELKEGQTIEAKGPDGEFVVNDPNKEYVFIAGGIGITPYHSILLDLKEKGKPINATLLYANKDRNIVFQKELESLKNYSSTFKIVYFLSPQRINEETIKENVSNFLDKIFYVSGPEPMVEVLQAMVKKMGVKKENVVDDYFPGYESF